MTTSSATCLKVDPRWAAELERAALRLQFEEAELADADRQAQLRDELSASCPAYGDLVATCRERVQQPPHHLRVTGLCLDPGTRVLLALMTGLGQVLEPYRKPWSRIVQRVEPATDFRAEGHGVLNERLHTDGTSWPTPNWLTCLLCVRSDASGGGHSRLLDLDLLLDQADRARLPLALLRRKPVPWNIASELGGGVRWEPVLGPGTIRWMRYSIETAMQRYGLCLSDELVYAIGRFEEFLDQARVQEFKLNSGELMIVHNAKCLHARSPVRDPERSGRVMLRVKIGEDAR
jgi:alpha-ketoglutarate-dependent taurine dioxygenase